MDKEVPFLSGYLNVPTQSGFLSKKKSCQKFCLLFKSSQYGIERLEICEFKEDKNAKIFTLEDCVKITQETCPSNLICIVKKTDSLTLNAPNEQSLKEWVNALQMVAFRSKNDNTSLHSAIEEDNDLYCSSYGDGLFIVTLIPSEASIRCNIESKVYMLHLTTTELQLKDTSNLSNIISTWPYRFIRKYGYRNGKFTFEAGRKCLTGEGVFTLDHSNPQEVFRCMSSKMKSMKKMISGDGVKLDNCENQLNVAASKEARSRSPLLPSPSNHIRAEFELNSAQSSFSVRRLMPICESFGTSVSVLVPQKSIPNKPPRKIYTTDNLHKSINFSPSNKQLFSEKVVKQSRLETVTITSSSDPNKAAGSSVMLTSSPETSRHFQETEISFPEYSTRNDIKNERNYESIESITDAWKTLGINDVKHNEYASSTDHNDEIWTRSNYKRASIPKIIDIDIGECAKGNFKETCSDITYDHLDFLSANHKTSNGYKTVVTVAPLSNNNIIYKAPQNEYELITLPETSNRKSFESFAGYGALRHSGSLSSSASEIETISSISKNITVNVETDKAVNYNSGLNYAVVSKTKNI